MLLNRISPKLSNNSFQTNLSFQLLTVSLNSQMQIIYTYSIYEHLFNMIFSNKENKTYRVGHQIYDHVASLYTLTRLKSRSSNQYYTVIVIIRKFVLSIGVSASIGIGIGYFSSIGIGIGIGLEKNWVSVSVSASKVVSAHL